MDQGEDFSKALKHASKVVDDPEITQQSIARKSKAASSFYQFLECIVPYGKAKQAELGSSAKPQQKSKSPPAKEKRQQ